MELSPDLKKANFWLHLKRGMIFRLKGSQPFPSDAYHLFVVLNYDPQSGKVLFLVNGTSQVEKRWQTIEKIKRVDAGKTTVYFSPGSYSYITKDTLFDCNQVHEVNTESLDFSDDAVKMIGDSEQLSEEDIERLVQAVLESPLVSEYVKSHLVAPQKPTEQ